MIKKLIRHVNSFAMIIDKPIMELLNIDTNSHLELSTDGANLIISPVKNKNRINRLKKSLENINDKRNTTLRKLAE